MPHRCFRFRSGQSWSMEAPARRAGFHLTPKSTRFTDGTTRMATAFRLGVWLFFSVVFNALPSHAQSTLPMAIALRNQPAPIVDASQVEDSSLATLQPADAATVRPQSPIDTAIVCAPQFLPLLKTWIQYRRNQGHEFVHISGLRPSREIQTAVRVHASKHPLRYVVIFGDADPDMMYDARVRRRCVPTFYAEARVTSEWGSEPYIASDNPYADLNGDHVPDLAIGRICFDRPDQLETILQKIIHYEEQASPGAWRRRVHLTAGVGGFGAIADAAIEAATKKFITDLLPAEYDVTLTHGSWRSAYCPDPRLFRETVLRRVQSGGLFWVYMGHGYPERLDRLTFGDSVVPILEADDVRYVRSKNGPPIALLLACYTGAYDQDQECFAERLVQTPDGPIAAIAGSRVTMPYGMAIFATSMLDGYFEKKLDCLGDVFIYAKKSLSENSPSPTTARKLLDTAAVALSPGKDKLDAERTEHQLLFQLLGDPLTQLAHPKPIHLQCRTRIKAGETLRISGKSAIGGKCLVELVCRRDRLTFEAPRRLKFRDDSDALAEMMTVYAKANDRRWTGHRLDVTTEPFELEIEVPEEAHGASFVRVFIQGQSEYAMASQSVFIQSPTKNESLRTSNAQR